MLTEIIRMRKNCGMSQLQLAELTGTTQQYISAIERCERIPNVILGIRIAKALRSTVEEVFIDNLLY